MRANAPIFIPHNSPTTQQPQSPASHWLALETICATWDHAQRTGEPLIAVAARTLDLYGAQLESDLLKMTMNPAGFAPGHEGMRVPKEAVDAFHQAIIKRLCLAPRVWVDDTELADSLRALTGLPSKWLDDNALVESIPRELMERLKKSLVCIIDRTSELDASTHSSTLLANTDSIDTAIGNTRTFWDEWALTLRAQYLPPAPPPIVPAREMALASEILNRLSTTAPEQRMRQASLMLDQLGLLGEDALSIATRNPTFVDRITGRDADAMNTWASVESLLAARSQAKPNLAELGDALANAQTIQGSTLSPQAGLFMPAPLTALISRCQAGLTHAANGDAASLGAVFAHLEQHAPDLWQHVLTSLQEAGDRLNRFQSHAGGLDVPLAAMLTVMGQAESNQSVDSAARHALLNTSDPFDNPPSSARATRIADTLEALRAKAPDTIQSNTAGVWLQALARQANRHATEVETLKQQLDQIGLGGQSAITRTLAEGASVPGVDRVKLARKLFALYQALPADEREALQRKSGLAERKMPQEIRDMLAWWRRADEPALTACADLYERLASRVREGAKPSTPPNTEGNILAEAMSAAAAERDEAKKSGEAESSEMRRFLAAAPATGNLAQRQRAIRKYLQSLPPMPLCTLLIDASNVMMASRAYAQMSHLKLARTQKTALVMQVIPEAARLVRSIGSPPQLGELRAIINKITKNESLALLLATTPLEKLPNRLLACADNFSVWAVALSRATTPSSRSASLSQAGLPEIGTNPQLTEDFWQLSTEETLRANALGNYMDLRYQMIQMAGIGPEFLALWETALDRYAAHFDDQQSGHRFFEDVQQLNHIAIESIKEINTRFGPALILLGELPEFQRSLMRVLELSGQIAGAAGRANPGALLAFLLAEGIKVALSAAPPAETTLSM